MGFQRLQDWAFTHGFALAIESATAKGMRLECVHHKRKTKNSRKTSEETPVRVETQTKSRNRQFENVLAINGELVQLAFVTTTLQIPILSSISSTEAKGLDIAMPWLLQLRTQMQLAIV